MKYVAYIRVSTKKQNVSGLGLEAQKSMINAFVKEGDAVTSEFVEVETGTNKRERPELTKAINECKANGYTLIIAKLDRLARNVRFVSELMESKINFICCDMPEATPFTIHIFAALAEQEAKLISERTKSALQELKNKGVKLGNPQHLTDESRKKAVESNIQRAKNNQNNKRAVALIKELRARKQSYRAIAEQLNEYGYKSSANMEFKPMTVKRLYDRSQGLIR